MRGVMLAGCHVHRALAAGCVVLLGLASCSTGESVAEPTVSETLITPSEPPDQPTVPDLVDESCGEIARATAGVQEAMDAALEDITTAPEAFTQVAENLRAAAADAGAEARAAAEDMATVLEDYADRIRSGDLLALDWQAFTGALEQLALACS